MIPFLRVGSGGDQVNRISRELIGEDTKFCGIPPGAVAEFMMYYLFHNNINIPISVVKKESEPLAREMPASFLALTVQL